MNSKLLLKIAGIAGSVIMMSACATGPDLTDGSGMSEAPGGPVPGSMEDLAQNVGNAVYFGYDEYTLTPQAQATLARQAAWLQEYPEATILVAGNCDERGTREYNLALGARRAEAARAYLTSLGVDSGRISTVSHGKERPVDPRSTEEAWSLNRNATTTLK